jgi:membrane-associated phospholipid phosphatase
MALGRLAPVDRWTVAYTAFASLAILDRWPRHLPVPPVLLVGHAALALLALWAPALRRKGPAARFVGDFYALACAPLLYTAIGVLNTAAGVAHDATVQAWEEVIFSGQPSRAWIRHEPWPALSAVLHAGYLSYYFVVAAAPLGLWISGRRDGARRTIALSVAAFYLCYVVFLVFPVAGPRYLFPPAENAATAVAPARLARALLEAGSAWGTAFPSSHVAVAVVASATAWRECRPFGTMLLLLTAFLCLGTVYGQFHYAVDAVAGIAVAVAVLFFGRRLEK